MNQAVDRRQWVTPEDLNVAPEVLGLPLASPGRRALAMATDLAAIALVSALANFWWLCAGALLGLDHARRQQAGRRPWRRWWVWGAAAALLAAGALQSWDEHSRPARPRAARAAAGAVPASGAAADTAEEADDDDEDAAVARATRQLLAAAAAASAGASAAGASAPLSGAGASAAPQDAGAALGLALAHQGRRIHQLETQLAEARARRSLDPRVWLRRWSDELGLGYGFSLLYFSLLPAWWGGQTLGKRLLRLRVVELTGKPMTALRCLKRFGGYAAGMATGGLGFVQVLWDPNRQAIQDKTAHTAVVDLRRPRLILDPGAPAGTTSLPPATTSLPR
ncbi:RDD family protein [Aquabacterium sp.]|uniref:RDD family protein n=1 Tax=Aquabacterium sp. TaxID=1872578 RepID=UPI0037849019